MTLKEIGFEPKKDKPGPLSVAGVAVILHGNGGNDTVTIEDSSFNQKTSISLGRGNDALLVEQGGANPGPVTTFNGQFSFSGGSGNDTVTLGIPANAGNQVVFAGRSFFNGGSGLNTHTLPENVIYGLPAVFVNF